MDNCLDEFARRVFKATSFDGLQSIQIVVDTLKV